MPSPSASGFDDQFEQARFVIFRLETLQNYGGSGEDPALTAFLAGQPYLITPGKRKWLELVRRRTEAGCQMQRVHVVTEPLTDYIQFELTWGYAPNVDVGEDIRILSVPAGQLWPAGLPENTDFWLFDSSVLYAMHYNPAGNWLGVELITDQQRIAQACHWRDAALGQAKPWRVYIAQRPELCRHIAGISTAS